MKFALVLLALIVLTSGCLSGSEMAASQTEETSDTNQLQETQQEVEQTSPSGIVITITDSGFSPQELTVKVGDTVTWQNDASRGVWPASAFHPTHRNYPGSDIEKCGTDVEIFDSCGDIQPGDSWSFTFEEIGTWPYHDHSRASVFGRVIVE